MVVVDVEIVVVVGDVVVDVVIVVVVVVVEVVVIVVVVVFFVVVVFGVVVVVVFSTLRQSTNSTQSHFPSSWFQAVPICLQFYQNLFLLDSLDYQLN